MRKEEDRISTVGAKRDPIGYVFSGYLDASNFKEGRACGVKQ